MKDLMTKMDIHSMFKMSYP